ncbi:putative SNQ2-ABC transporter [Tilletiaria anomala UBC 951]|uniref:Putative SNQ2-ABC transporter n=1 Tax=Tilletiaria anomala (strain ATCC 24038 / CBS 436.72 / UBC 951) TaxID=1037660 RepID=A0A066W1I1_TILAU|nr:putative SNQ2-ABC transporter [Tilletiaria anomala UBC 951]KDN44914.1 putative SNQ2-ABC transporter [Tilletiaria anomala UBC 951]
MEVDSTGEADSKRAQQNIPRDMGVAWKNLTVTGVGASATLGSTVGSVLMSPLNFKIMLQALNPPVKEILHNFNGNVRAGEMLLVLGRPGSGCTTFLKMLASYRDGYRSVEGDVLYEGLDHKVVEGPLRGELVYAAEDDVHFASLSVGRTLNFAIGTRAPQAAVRPGFGANRNTRTNYVATMREVIATTLGLKHTYKTPVGNELIRGVSGGEKKRVSIAELLATRARIQIFDNSSRGLDSSTAVEFIQSLRILANTTRTTTIASIYQAGEPIYRLFDKVVVLYAGRTVYFGPVDKAVEYFVEMGYVPHEHQTSSDFLVSVTDPHARIVRNGYKGKVPLTAEEMEAYWCSSEAGRASMEGVDNEIKRMKGISTEEAADYLANARLQKAKGKRKSSPFLLSWSQEIRLCIQRRAQIVAGDMATQIVLVAATAIQGIINGSVFLNLPGDTSGFFSRGGVLFFLLLYNSFMAQAEVGNGYMQRPIVIRHKKFAMVHPSADALANTLLDIPVRLISIIVFDVLLYFMTGLARTADQFFILLATTALLTYTMVAFFRFLAASFRSEANAVLLGGLAIIDFSLYAGYIIPRPSMVWWRWLSYCNPIAFGFEILMANEFRRLRVPCALYIPYGPTYANVPIENKACPTIGAVPGQELIDGNAYIAQSYGYYWSNSRRNVGILIGFWIAFVIFYAVANEFQMDPSASGGVMVFKRGAKKIQDQNELEQAAARNALKEGEHGDVADRLHTDAKEPPTSTDIFAWDHINYDVTIKGGEVRRLLNDVSGYVQPGKMTALMGASGAGKTTLLNVLAQRVDVGVVQGDFLVNGRPLLASFQAQTGYCQQQDNHLPTTTVREALEFSALLRQPTGTKAEKLAYVDEVLEMLDMQDWADALVGEVSQGLSVEQRKRLTIGVELAAKPKLLLFLDEPTSGMDSLAAWSIVRFLKRLANAGQSILCTIHQPSGELFSQFDRLILLKKGGEVVFAGDIHNSKQQCGKLLEYFEPRSGRLCGDDNPAEYILECIGAGAAASTDKNWSAMYKESELYMQMQSDLAKIFARRDDPQFDAKDADLAAKEFATGFFTQLWAVEKRTIMFYWRNPVYIWAKLGLNIVSGVFVGSSFYGQGKKGTIASLQNQIFGVFIGLVLSTSLSQQLQPVFLQMRNLFEARERPSKIYSWPVLVLSALLTELPWNWLGGTLFWIPWQFFIMPWSCFQWFMYSIIFQSYFVTFALAIAALSPNAMVGAIIFSTFFSFVIVFCGVVQPPPLLPHFWRVWMFPLSPFTYLIESLMGNTLAGTPIRCAPYEFSTIVPPAGQTCDQYLGGFSMPLANLSNPNAPRIGVGYYTQEANGCAYCQYREGGDYLSSVNLNAAYRFRDIGILCAYIFFNCLLFFFFFWIFRIASFKKQRNSKLATTMPGNGAQQAVEDTVERGQDRFADTELGAATLSPQATDTGSQAAKSSS